MSDVLEQARLIDNDVLTDNQKEVLQILTTCGDLTDKGILNIATDAGTQQSPSGLRTRRNELVKEGYVTQTDTVVVDNRTHKVWGTV